MYDKSQEIFGVPLQEGELISEETLNEFTDGRGCDDDEQQPAG